MPAGAGSSKTLSYTPWSLGVGQKRVDLGLSREGKEQRGRSEPLDACDRSLGEARAPEPGALTAGPLSGYERSLIWRLGGAGARKETGPPDTQYLHFLPLCRARSPLQPQSDPHF